MSQRPRSSTLFPYTTLFRSLGQGGGDERGVAGAVGRHERGAAELLVFADGQRGAQVAALPPAVSGARLGGELDEPDRKSTRLNSSHPSISYAVFCLKKKKQP